MRFYQLVTIACALTCPHAVTAEGASQGEQKQADVPNGQQSDDPLVAGFPKFVEWFRSHGGISKSSGCSHNMHAREKNIHNSFVEKRYLTLPFLF